MFMEEKCLCEPTEILIFPCSGGSNVGQIANQAGVQLTQKGMGRFFCLAGIGGHVSGMVESTKAGKMLVAIDGCPVACAKKTLEHAGFSIDEYVQVTDLGIEKNHDLVPPLPDVKKVAAHLVDRIAKRRGAWSPYPRTVGAKRMTIKSVVFHLSPEEALKLTRILLDEDKGEALLFLKECLKPQLEQATRDHWVPVFEASYKPSQKDTFNKR
jgi:uncharacterized metal-binding protein